MAGAVLGSVSFHEHLKLPFLKTEGLRCAPVERHGKLRNEISVFLSLS